LAGELRLTGANVTQQARDLLSPATDRVDGYVTRNECDGIVRNYFLVEDTTGNVTLRVTDFPEVAAWVGTMPAAVVGIDLLDSAEPREAEAGRRLVEGLLP